MRRWIITAAAASIALPAIVPSVHAKPVQWKKSRGGNNHWYEAVPVPEGIGWVDALLRASARGCGWHLATITSPVEDRFLSNLLANSSESFWLGGYQKNSNDEPAGNWAWVTGEKFDYTDWSAGEPNDGFGLDEDYLHYLPVVKDGLSDFGWNDLFQTTQPGYLAELDIPRPPACRSRQ
jgi:hypothetical protein